MVPLGKILKNLNCHNSGCTQDRVVIFGSLMCFSGADSLSASFKFTFG